MFKKDLWCGYCGSKKFTELKDAKHPNDSRYSAWQCQNCEACFEMNEGYGWFTISWGKDENENKKGCYSLGTGELLDKNKLPRTPEGIMRHSFNAEDLKSYLGRTQIQ